MLSGKVCDASSHRRFSLAERDELSTMRFQSRRLEEKVFHQKIIFRFTEIQWKRREREREKEFDSWWNLMLAWRGRLKLISDVMDTMSLQYLHRKSPLLTTQKHILILNVSRAIRPLHSFCIARPEPTSFRRASTSVAPEADRWHRVQRNQGDTELSRSRRDRRRTSMVRWDR